MIFILIFIFVLIIVIFLNVLIYRLRASESVFFGRSKCPKCKHVLGFWDLIPVLSFLRQKGKCRYCGKNISWQYPAVELATAALFVAAYAVSGFHFSISGGFSVSGFHFLNLSRMWFFIAVMVVIFVYDLRYYLILDKVIYPAAVVALLTSFMVDYAAGCSWSSISIAILGSVAGGGFFLSQYVISRGKWIGGGDIGMGFLMGLILGLPNLLVAFFFAYMFGALVGLGLIIFGKKTIKSQIPFGTFLAIGAIIAMFWGEKIIRLYLG